MRHICICAATGTGHYTPAFTLANVLHRQFGSELFITFIAPIRATDKAGSVGVLPAEQQLEIGLRDCHPITMEGVLRLREEIAKIAHEFLGDRTPDMIIHDMFATYAPVLSKNYYRNASTYLLCTTNMCAATSFTAGILQLEDRGEISRLPGLSGLDLRTALIASFQFECHSEPTGIMDMFGLNVRGVIWNDIDGVCKHLQVACDASMQELVQRIYGNGQLSFRSYCLGGVILNERLKTESDTTWNQPAKTDSDTTRNQPAKTDSDTTRNQPTKTDSDTTRNQPTKTDSDTTLLEWVRNQPAKSVVVVCFGTLYALRTQALVEFCKALLDLPYDMTVVWSYKERSRQVYMELGESEEDEKLRHNYMDKVRIRHKVVEWIPLPKILSYHAVRMFITHGGWNSLMEAIFYTPDPKPLVIVPLGSDQFINGALCEYWRVGKMAIDGPKPKSWAPQGWWIKQDVFQAAHRVMSAHKKKPQVIQQMVDQKQYSYHNRQRWFQVLTTTSTDYDGFAWLKQKRVSCDVALRAFVSECCSG